MKNKSLKKSIFANLYGQVVSVVIQVFSLPVFMFFWGAERYGIWLIITAIPAYISIADGGVASVAANKMVFLKGDRKSGEAQNIFSCTLLIILIVGGVLFSAFCFCVYVISFWVPYIKDNFYSISVLGAVTVLTIFSGISDVIFRPIGMNAFCIYTLNTVRFLEWIFCLFFVYLYDGIFYAAVGMLIARCFGVIFIFASAKKFAPELKWSISGAGFRQSKKLFIESVGFMSFPISNALIIQGGVIIVGSVYGPVSVVVYSAYRTISRTITQMLTLISRSLWASITELYSEKNNTEITKIVNKTINIATAMSIFVSAAILLFGASFVNFWSKGSVIYDPIVMALMLASTCVTSVWQIKMVAILATNNHNKINFVYMAGAIIFVACISINFGQRYMMFLSCAHVFYEIFMAKFIGNSYRRLFCD